MKGAPRKRREYFFRDARPRLIPRLVSLGRIERKRASGEPKAESSTPEGRPMMAVVNFACLLDKHVIRYHGHWRFLGYER